jgi:hypothetical protein
VRLRILQRRAMPDTAKRLRHHDATAIASIAGRRWPGANVGKSENSGLFGPFYLLTKAEATHNVLFGT